MSEARQIEIHERVTRLEEKQANTFEMIATLTKVVAQQGKNMTRAIIVGIILLTTGIIANGGTEAFVQVLKNISSGLI